MNKTTSIAATFFILSLASSAGVSASEEKHPEEPTPEEHHWEELMSRSVGRFRIERIKELPGGVILLDTASGDTFSIAEDGKGWIHWRFIPRISPEEPPAAPTGAIPTMEPGKLEQRYKIRIMPDQ